MSADQRDWPWSELGLDGPSSDPRAVRRAYAKRLKAADPDQSVETFEALRGAYEAALAMSGGKRPTRARVIPAQPDWAPSPVTPLQSLQRPATVTQESELEEDQASAPPIDTEPAPLTTDPAPNSSPDFAPLEGTDAKANAPNPEPSPASPWLRPTPDTLRARVRELLEQRNRDRDLWRRLLTNPMLDNPSFRAEIEYILVQHLNDFSPFPEWTRVLDDRFNWRADGVGFQRRYPWARGAQERILALSSTSPPVPPPEAMSQIRPRAGLVVGGAIILIGLLGMGNDTTRAAVVGLIFTILLTGIGYAVLALLIRLIFRAARIVPVLEERLFTFVRWWARPIGKLSKNMLATTAFFATSFFLFTMVSINRSATIIAGSTKAVSAAALDRSNVGLRPYYTATGLDRSLRELTPRIVWSHESSELGRPFERLNGTLDALLECWEGAGCQLAMRSTLSAQRRMTLETDGIRPLDIQTSLSPASLVLYADDSGEVSGQLSSGHDHTDYELIHDREGKKLGSAIYTLFAPALTTTDGPVPLTMPGMNTGPGVTPLHPTQIATPLKVVVPWPALPLGALACRIGVGPATDAATMLAAGCIANEGTITWRTGWVCPEDDSFLECDIAIRRGATSAQRVGAKEIGTDAISDEFTHPIEMVLPDLLLRMASNSPQPPLPDTPMIREIRDAVAQDYLDALTILDKPEEQRDADAFQIVLRRQPQLNRLYRENSDKRARTWVQFMARMTEIGFDMETWAERFAPPGAETP